MASCSSGLGGAARRVLLFFSSSFVFSFFSFTRWHLVSFPRVVCERVLLFSSVRRRSIPRVIRDFFFDHLLNFFYRALYLL